MRKSLPGLLLAIALAGCDVVEGRRDAVDTQEELKGIIREEIGVDSYVGFNVRNGTLIDVSITLNAQDVADRSVSELERLVQSAVRRSFETSPGTIYIQLATTAQKL